MGISSSFQYIARNVVIVWRSSVDYKIILLIFLLSLSGCCYKCTVSADLGTLFDNIMPPKQDEPAKIETPEEESK